MLSASILYFAATSTATRPAPAPGPAAAATTAAAPSPQQIQQQIDQAVTRAVATVEARQAEKNRQLVAFIESRNAETLRSARWIASESEADRKRAQVAKQMAMYVQPGESGGAK